MTVETARELKSLALPKYFGAAVDVSFAISEQSYFITNIPRSSFVPL